MKFRYALATSMLCFASACAGGNSETSAAAAAQAAFRPPPGIPAPPITAPVTAPVTVAAITTPAAPIAVNTAEAAVTPMPAPVKVEVTDASFGCIRDLTPVRGFYVGNLLGNLDATLAAANNSAGAVYPPGSLVQLIPGEAMVKHAPGFNPATRDWEFFELDVRPQSTKIAARGGADIVSPLGGACITCHGKADAKWDMICEQRHGCDPLPVTPGMARAIQNTDPRCARMVLPADQLAALVEFAADRAAAATAAAPAAP